MPNAHPPILPNWKAVCIVDEQMRDWNLPAHIRAALKSIDEVWFYDESSRSYLCEMTPSYEMHFLHFVPAFQDNVSDELKEEIDQFICSEYLDCSYMHCHTVDAMEKKADYGQENDPDYFSEDAVREYWQSNYPF